MLIFTCMLIVAKGSEAPSANACGASERPVVEINNKV
jgi:hypothetical protein